VTDRDIALRLVADDHITGTTVEGVMTEGAICCHPDDDIAVAEALMKRFHKSRIVCADEGGHAVGVISLADLAHIESPDRVGLLLREITNRETHLDEGRDLGAGI